MIIFRIASSCVPIATSAHVFLDMSSPTSALVDYRSRWFATGFDEKERGAEKNWVLQQVRAGLVMFAKMLLSIIMLMLLQSTGVHHVG